MIRLIVNGSDDQDERNGNLPHGVIIRQPTGRLSVHFSEPRSSFQLQTTVHRTVPTSNLKPPLRNSTTPQRHGFMTLGPTPWHGLLLWEIWNANQFGFSGTMARDFTSRERFQTLELHFPFGHLSTPSTAPLRHANRQKSSLSLLKIPDVPSPLLDSQINGSASACAAVQRLPPLFVKALSRGPPDLA
ncbi:hypothetical protein VTK56DRAFT_12 [Thermocarpiscus australiensis]